MDPEKENPRPVRPLRAVIVGGSLSGLMYGLVLARAGHVVTIVERNATYGSASSQAAGVHLGPYICDFLASHDKSTIGLGSAPSTLVNGGLRLLKPDGSTRTLVTAAARTSSWANLWLRLRGSFDALAAAQPEPGHVAYHAGVEVTDVTITDGRPLISFRRTDKAASGRVSDVDDDSDDDDISDANGDDNSLPAYGSITADLVIGADGAHSRVRDLLARGQPPPRYSGYVAWRGTVPETSVSASAVATFAKYSMAATHQGGYILCYNIPGRAAPGNANGTAPGSRLLNFVWYANARSPAALARILTDVDGRLHRRSIAPGALRPDIWAEQRLFGVGGALPGPFAELIGRVEAPFVQAIDDFTASSPLLAGGRAMLVGEAFAVLRPHNGSGASMTARGALLFERVVRGEASLHDWARGCRLEICAEQGRAQVMGELLVNGYFSALLIAARVAWSRVIGLVVCNVEKWFVTSPDGIGWLIEGH